MENETEPDHEQPDYQQPPFTPAKTSKKIPIIIGVVASAIVALIAGILIFTNRGVSENDVQASCKEVIDDMLKSPSTAKYSDWKTDDFLEEDSDAWYTTVNVDAQNSFGATVRSKMICTTFLDDETGELTSIALGDE